MSSAPERKITAAEYLEAERAATTKSILFRGEMFAISGAKRPHILITGNVASAINVQLQDSLCEVYAADMRVKNRRTGSYFYPDVSATCESPKFEDDVLDTLLNPQVIIEVLSESTEKFDRVQKFDDYKLLDSVKEYVLISQKRMHVERFTRQTESTWEYWSAKNASAVLSLASIGCQMSLAQIYNKIEFKPDDANDRGEDDLRVIEEKSPFFSR
jgi:Uma2 family endonuclease